MAEHTPNNNQLDASNYGQIEPSDVTGSNQNYPGLILKQLERINYLLAMGTQNLASATGLAQIQTVPQLQKSIRRALRSIESMINPYLKEEYYTEVAKLKQKLTNINPKNEMLEDEAFELLGLWYDLLVKNLGCVDLLPQRSVEIDLTEDSEGEFL